MQIHSRSPHIPGRVIIIIISIIIVNDAGLRRNEAAFMHIFEVHS